MIRIVRKLNFKGWYTDMKFKEHVTKLQGVKVDLINTLNHIQTLVDLYKNFKKDPVGSIETIVASELTAEHSIFKEEISLGIKQPLTYDIAYNKCLSELQLLIKDHITLFKSTLDRYKLSDFLKETQELNNKNSLTDTKFLYDKKEVINRTVDKNMFYKRTLNFLHSIYRGDLLNGKEVNSLFINLNKLVKGLFTGITSTETINLNLNNVKQSTFALFKNNVEDTDLKTLYSQTLKPYVSIKLESIPDSDLDSIINLICNNVNNVSSGFKDEPNNVYVKYSDLINTLTLKAKVVNDNLGSLNDSVNTTYQSTLPVVWDTFNKTFDNLLVSLETDNNSEEIINRLKQFTEILQDLFSYIIGMMYYIKAEVDIFKFVFNVLQEITVISNVDLKRQS